VRLTSPPSCAKCREIWEPKSPGKFWATPGLVRDSCSFNFTNHSGFTGWVLWPVFIQRLSVAYQTAECQGIRAPCNKVFQVLFQ
jgi:hypothetical protein